MFNTGGLPAVRSSTNTARPVQVADGQSARLRVHQSGEQHRQPVAGGVREGTDIQTFRRGKTVARRSPRTFPQHALPALSNVQAEAEPAPVAGLAEIAQCHCQSVHARFEYGIQIVCAHKIIHLATSIAVHECAGSAIEQDIVRGQLVVGPAHGVLAQQFGAVHVDFHLVVKSGTEARVQAVGAV